MNWYVAKIIYQVITGDGAHTPQFDEQFRLIKADEPAWAQEKALVLGRRGQTTFLNTSSNEQVHWKFIAVADICRVDNIEDGVQLYAQTGEPGDAEEYITLTRTRAQCMTDHFAKKECKSQFTSLN